MTVGAAELMWSQTRASYETTNTRDRKATLQEGYTIVTGLTDKWEQVKNASGLPQINQVYSGTSHVRVRRVTPQKLSPIFWMVIVEYGGETGPDGEYDAPTNTPPSIKWSEVTTDEAIDEDFDGNPIVTANNEPIEGITTPISDLVLTVRRNYVSINLPATHAYLRSVNSDTFAGFAAGTGRLKTFSADFVVAQEAIGGGYWDVNAQVIFRYPYNTTADKAWYARVRHEGYYESVGGVIKRAVDDNKDPVTKPVLLKSDGTRETVAANAHWLEWKRFAPLPYNALGLL